MNRKILLVDGDETILHVFGEELKKAGFEVETAMDGKTGLEKARTEQVNLILLGQILPDMKGNEILKTLKSDNATKNIPIAILSNFGQQELVHEAFEEGALDYILKYQIAPKDLPAKVENILKNVKQ